MIPMTSLEVAHLRAAELHRSAARSRSARQVALAARQRDLVARRTLRAELPDRPIVTARAVRPQATAPRLPVPTTTVPTMNGPTTTVPAAGPEPERQPVGVAARADADALTPCTTC
jgi:hypothetical protein